MNPENEFKRFGILKVQNYTYKGTFVIATLSNFISEQSYNRGSKRWTKAEFVVLDTSFSGPSQEQFVLEAWRNITKFKDQFLVVPDGNGKYTAYNYAGMPMGSGTISDLLTNINGK